MAETIRGINVKIGSDTSGLSAALKDVNKNSRSIAGELRKVERLLKFSPKNTELLSQKQKLLSDQVETTREKLNRLKTAQEQVNAQFQKGDITEGQYRAFQRELVKTESQLKHYESQLKSATSQSGNFAQKMQEVGKKLQSAGDKMKSVGQTLSRTVTASITAAGVALGAMATKAAQSTDRIDKLSQRLGLSRKGFQEWEFILSQSGTTMESLQSGMKVMVQRMDDLKNGTGIGAEAFQKLGISLEDIQGLSQEDVFKLTVQRFNQMADGAEKANLAQDLFSRSGQNLLPLLNQNAGAVEKMTQQAHDLGLVLSNESIDAGVEFTDILDQMKRSLGAAFTQIGVKLMPAFKSLVPIIQDSIVPAVKSLAEKVGNLAKWFANLSPVAQKIILAVTGLAAALGPVLIVMGSIVSAIGALTPLLSTLGGVIAGISAPVVGAVAAIAALAAIAIEVYRNWDEAKKALLAIFDTLKNAVKTLVSFWKLEFTALKAAVLTVIEAIVNKLSILEKIPGIGDKFKGLSDAIGDSAKKARAEVAKMADELKNNAGKVVDSAKDTGVAFADMGKAVKDDIAGVIKAITGQTKVVEEEQKKQVDSTKESEEEKTEIVSEEEKKRAELREKFETDWNQKLFDLTSTRLEQLDVEKKAELQKAEELGADKTAIVQYYALKRQEILDEELAKEEEREQKRLDAIAKFEQSWSEKLFQSTATNLEILEKEKNQALANAEELGASKANIIRYYALKEQEILDTQAEEEREKQEERLRNIENFEQSWSEKLFQQTASRAGILEAEKRAALEKAEELGADKTAIIEYYANEQQRLLDEQREKEKEAEQLALEEKQKNAEKEREIVRQTAKSWTDSYMSIVNSLVEGTKTIKEVLKDLLVQFLTMKEKEVLIEQMAQLARALAQSWIDWSAVARAGAAIAASTAAFEGAKALVKGLKDGAVIPAGANQLYRLGDGREDEAAIPLNDKVLGAIGAGIAANMPQQQMVVAGGGGRDIHLHIGTLVADDYSVKKLGRKIREVIIAEDKRRGG